MATGRRDYTWGYLNEASRDGRYIMPFIDSSYTTVAPGAIVECYRDNVPEGYRFGISRIEMSGGTGIENSLDVYIGGVLMYLTFFDTDRTLELSDRDILYASEIEQVIVSIYNNDTVEASYHVVISGTLEPVT